MDAFVRRKAGTLDVPDLDRLIYRPWLYAITKVGTKLDRTWEEGSSRKLSAPTDTGLLAEE
jgi:hypothetical protein